MSIRNYRLRVVRRTSQPRARGRIATLMVALSLLAAALVPATTAVAQSNLVATAVSSTQVNLTWTFTNDVPFGQEAVYRCTGSGCTPTTTDVNGGPAAGYLAALGANVGAYTDNTVTAGNTYNYQVAWINGSGLVQGVSNVAPATTPPPTTSVPPTPTPGVSSTGSVSASVTVEQPFVSVTVAPTSVAFGSCTINGAATSGLLTPNGECSTSAVSLTYTSNVPVNIKVKGANALGNTPPANHPGWALCQSGTSVGQPGYSTCADQGTLALPGPDQYRLRVGAAQELTNQFACDRNITAQLSDCSAGLPIATAPGTTTTGVSLSLVGPQASTDLASTTFTTSVSWLVIQR